MFGTRPMTFVNAAVVTGTGGVVPTLRVRRGVIDAVGSEPHRGDGIVDLGGAVIVHGLINAHDHLELNSFGRLKWRETYANVREWIADFQPRFAADPALADARRETLHDRLWVGALKNLLAGVTTVCHHNPLHRRLRRRFPVRVVRRFGMSHSLQIDGRGVAEAYRRTPADWPWIIHAAEGVDADARQEVRVLRSLRCVGPNTVLVHGVGVGASDADDLLDAGASLVWCPTSNDFLFGSTAEARPFSRAGRLAIGTDSRLSGEGDLLDELRAARRTRQVSPEALVRAVTVDAARVLRLGGAGRLEPGAPADLVVLGRRAFDPYESIVASTRGDVRLTMVGGVPLVAAPDLEPVFVATRQRPMPVRVDGRERLLARWIARRAAALTLREEGLEVA